MACTDRSCGKATARPTALSWSKDIRPGGDGSSPGYLAFVNGALFFAANDGRNGLEALILKFDRAAPPARWSTQRPGRAGVS